MLQNRSIDDNLRQLVLIRQDRVLVNCTFFSLLFQKNGSVGRWMGNETFYGNGLIGSSNSIFNSLSPESDQCQISPCIFFCFKKQSDHEN